MIADSRIMFLSELLDAVEGVKLAADDDVEVCGVKSDSRAVNQGDLFVAVPGVASDGHRFIANAVDRGAVAIVSEQPVDVSVVNVVVEDSARALALLAARYFGDAATHLRLFGVTGTNGKTSTAHLFRAIVNHSEVGPIGILGTIGHGIGSELEVAVHTTPHQLTLHHLLKKMKYGNSNGVVMEVSSHAVRQQRTWGLDFEIGMLTNITRDHLDYHSSFEDYIEAKSEFVNSLVSDSRMKPPGTLVYSIDNEHSRAIGEAFPGSKISVSIVEEADVYAHSIRATLDGTRFMLRAGTTDTRIDLRLLGEFSAANATMAAAAAHAIGIAPEVIKVGLESVSRVPGRFDALGGHGKPVVVVDYSHTPDSLERTLDFCQKLRPNRLISVFGCGGDRDRGKRPIMGEIAQRLSDITYVTSDNPRTEDRDAIIEDILEGMNRDAEGVRVEADRRNAIIAAVHEARMGDLVAVCGKGHEDYQIIGTTKQRFDDREEAEAALESWSSN